MHSNHYHFLLAILLYSTSHIVLADEPCQTIPAPNYERGWCYVCSSPEAPPLCNAQCSIAITALCKQDLTQSQIVTEQNCTLQYKPPIDPQFNRNGARPPHPSEDQCSITFNNILASCGRDAASPESATVDASYCTSSGGGGTYGWNDDGSVMTNELGRYIVAATNSDQCGQAQAPWHQSTSVVMCPDSFFNFENDTVTIDTNPPALNASVPADAPKLNPECVAHPPYPPEVCDIFGNPYYATIPVPPWPEGGKGSLRHRVVFEGWSVGANSHRLFNSIEDRCGKPPGNFQQYQNGTQTVADFDLPDNVCWCVKDAVFDASVGIQLPDDISCPSGTKFTSGQQVNRIELRHLRERGLKVMDPTRIVKKDWSGDSESLGGNGFIPRFVEETENLAG